MFCVRENDDFLNDLSDDNLVKYRIDNYMIKGKWFLRFMIFSVMYLFFFIKNVNVNNVCYCNLRYFYMILKVLN